MKVYDRLKNLIAKVEKQSNRLYVGKFRLAKEICLLTKLEEQGWLWHARYGHLNFHSLKKLSSKGMVDGMPKINQSAQICDGCIIGKLHRSPFPQKAIFRAKEPLELIHGDLCGPISPPT